MNRVLKYLIYAATLPAIGFLSMFVLRPITSGAHDGGFLGMVFGLTIGQILFASWLIEMRWYRAMLIGLLTAFVTIYFSFWTIWKAEEIFNPVVNSFFRKANEELEIKLKWVFFAVLIISSILIFEILNWIVRRKKVDVSVDTSYDNY